MFDNSNNSSQFQITSTPNYVGKRFDYGMLRRLHDLLTSEIYGDSLILFYKLYGNKKVSLKKHLVASMSKEGIRNV